MKMKALILGFLATTMLFTAQEADAARRKKKKFKGPIIVNQILKLNGTLNNNGQPALEFSGVKEGDTLETGEKTVAIVRVAGLGLVRLESKTKLVLAKYNNRDRSRFDLIAGNATFLIKRLGQHEVRFSQGGVKFTNVAAFNVVAEPTKYIDELNLYEGRLDLAVNDAPKPKAPAKIEAPKATPTPKPTPTPTPTPGVVGQVVITGSPTAAPVEAPSASPAQTSESKTPAVVEAAPVAPTPEQAPDIPAEPATYEMSVTSKAELKTFVITRKGLESRGGYALPNRVRSILGEMEALYALP